MFPRTSATCLVVCRLDIPEIETVAKNWKLLYVELCIKYWRKCIGCVYVYDFGLFNGAGVHYITSYPRVATTVSNRKLLPRARRKKRQHSTVMWRSCFSVLNGWVTGITDLHVPQPERLRYTLTPLSMPSSTLNLYLLVICQAKPFPVLKPPCRPTHFRYNGMSRNIFWGQ